MADATIVGDRLPPRFADRTFVYPDMGNTKVINSTLAIIYRYSALVVLVLLGGCGTPVPDQVAPLSGMFNAAPTRSPLTRVASGPGATLALIPSRNTVNNVIYLRSEQAAAVAGYGNPILLDEIRQACALSAEPRFITDWVTTSLKRNFGNVVAFDTLDAARAAQPDAFGVLDFSHVPIDWDRTTITSHATVIFFDSRMRIIGEASGRHATTVDGWAPEGGAVGVCRSEHQNRVRALEQFDQSLAQIVANPNAARQPTPRR